MRVANERQRRKRLEGYAPSAPKFPWAEAEGAVVPEGREMVAGARREARARHRFAVRNGMRPGGGARSEPIQILDSTYANPPISSLRDYSSASARGNLGADGA